MLSKQAAIEAFVENFRWLDRLAQAAFFLTVTAFIILLSGGEILSFMGAQFSRTHIFLVYFSLTVAHAYVALLVVTSFIHLWQVLDREERFAVWETVTSKGGFLVRGMPPEATEDSLAVLQGRPNRPPSYAVFLFVSLLLLVTVPLEIAKLTVAYYVLTCVLIVSNWLIALQWIMPLADLTAPRAHSRYLETLWEKDPEDGLVVAWLNRRGRVEVEKVSPGRALKHLLVWSMGMAVLLPFAYVRRARRLMYPNYFWRKQVAWARFVLRKDKEISRDQREG